MGGHGGHPSGYVLEISSRAEAPFDDARGRDDNAKLTERLTLKVYSLAENKKLTRKSKNRDFSTQQIDEHPQLPTDVLTLAQQQAERSQLHIELNR
ncbi:hypothetical protein SAMN04490206_3707 [Pseudomonas umsongensis]|jgi:hypothetical protein|nr:hypothetical protein SAMN04490206_3707 [Pseudomonas umsongensis]